MARPAPEAEAELEAFRQRWREEVSARNRRPESIASTAQNDVEERRRRHGAPGAPGPVATGRKQVVDYSEEIEPKVYHDLPDPEESLKLGIDGENRDRGRQQEPTSALEHYELAVEKETQGHLGDSIQHYRRAFRLDDGVHEAYKRKHFPPSAFVKPRLANPNPSNAAVTVPNTAHHSLHGGASALPPTLKQLVDGFSHMRIEAPPPPTDASPEERSFLGELPEEILTHILMDLAIADVASFARLSQVCRRLAYLVLAEEGIWKRVATGAEFGFKAMHYDFICEVDGDALDANDEIARYLDYSSEPGDRPPSNPIHTLAERDLAFSALTEHLLHSTYASSWRQIFRSRPRIRFNGCYISTVNYTRAGAQSTNTLTWGTPVHIVTYFRYLRFFRDGTVISLLTTSEPADVVHHLTKDNLHDHHGNVLPSSVMKDALRGRWRLSGPFSSMRQPATALLEDEGDVYVETEGVVDKYTYHMHFALAHAGKGARNNKLAWKSFGSYNRLTDDWGEFWLKNDRAFYWSRVKSYGMGY